MKTKITKLSASLALFVISGYVVCPTFVRAELGATAGPTTQLGAGLVSSKPASLIDFATATKVQGHVMKSLPSEQNRTALSLPTSCNQGDLLPDGSAIQTGKEADSSAELQWGTSRQDKKTTRIWANSFVRVFSRTPGRIDNVCLAKGALIFKKEHNEPNTYWVETKLLQARIRGTTVRVVSEPPSDGNPGMDKIFVLEGGRVQVKNKETGSIVELSTGVELAVKVKASYKCNDARFEIPTQTSRLNDVPTKVADYRLNPNKGELLFEDRSSSTLAYTVNAKAVLEDPMVKGNKDLAPFESIGLIESAMKRMPSSDNVMQNTIETALNFNHPDKFIADPKYLRISHVPDTKYSIGHNVGKCDEGKPISLPSTDNQPVARLDVNVLDAHIASAKSNMVQPMAIIKPVFETPAAEENPLKDEQERIENMALKHDSANNSAN